MFLDENNFYGHAMFKFLSTSGFRWIDPKEFYSNKCSRKKVDLEYLKELRELYNDYPLAPDRIKIKREMVSSYQRLLIFIMFLLLLLKNCT